MAEKRSQLLLCLAHQRIKCINLSDAQRCEFFFFDTTYSVFGKSIPAHGKSGEETIRKKNE